MSGVASERETRADASDADHFDRGIDKPVSVYQNAHIWPQRLAVAHEDLADSAQVAARCTVVVEKRRRVDDAPAIARALGEPLDRRTLRSCSLRRSFQDFCADARVPDLERSHVGAVGHVQAVSAGGRGR